ncbi:MAG: hypothetical protein N7Q72_00830, partial [Spiroplasma sp. Tabriz.8]|nr:hypothetical protein [Spiroplasma sp. Tabriz.8]
MATCADRPIYIYIYICIYIYIHTYICIYIYIYIYIYVIWKEYFELSNGNLVFLTIFQRAVDNGAIPVSKPEQKEWGQ